MDLNELLRDGTVSLDAFLDAAERETPVAVEQTEMQLAERGLEVLRALVSTHLRDRDHVAELVGEASLRIVELGFASRRNPTEVDSLHLQLGQRVPHGGKEPVRDLFRAVRREAKRQVDALRSRAPAKGRAGPDPQTWDRLRKSEAGPPIASLSNVVVVLEGDPVLVKRQIRWNDFAGRVEIDGGPVADNVEAELAVWLDDVYSIRVSTLVVHEAVVVVAHRHPHHPVRAYFDGLTWDRVERLDGMLSRWFGVDPTDDFLDVEMGRRWMIAAVARVFQPGCKVDTVLVLCGEQGAGKSSGLKALASEPWFYDSPIDIGGKDGMGNLRGSLIVELAELDALSRKEVTTVKAYFTQSVDKYRPPYGRNVVEVPRQCVFAGTVNGDFELKDPTGSRRFWVRRVCRPLDVAGILEHRDQIWAEAVHRYRAGEAWWLSRELDDARHSDAEQYQSTDPWTEPVLAWARARAGDHELATLAKEALGLETERLGAREEKRIGSILRLAGWTVHRRRDQGAVLRVWRAPGPTW